jgi:hypothetical protein
MSAKSDLPHGTLDLMIASDRAWPAPQVCDRAVEAANWQRMTAAVGLILRMSEGGAQ